MFRHVKRLRQGSNSTVFTIAGTGEEGHRDGEAGTVARFADPCGVAVDEDGNIIVADTGNHCIRKITPQGQVSTLAGTDEEGLRDGEGAVARFSMPCGLAVHGDGNIIVVDMHSCCVRKITPQGQVSTLAGMDDHEEGYRDGEGTVALFDHLRGIAVDRDGNVIVVDMGNHCIRKITPQGQVSTLAVTGEGGY
jgi:DNA-binding beta-propeller fold protein YncE